ncbi:MAG: hypothetical protein VKI83_02585 [Synechococcaceae cyanobacterium]|nr:hypothetical protein [Synechococcaceae cyanobacterium]
MLIYLLLITLLVPLNLWSAVAPHLLTAQMLPLLQLLTALVLLPGLLDLLGDVRRAPRWQRTPPLLLLALTATLIPASLQSSLHGTSLESGWIQHLLASLALLSLAIFYLGRPGDQTSISRLQERWRAARRARPPQ